MKEKEIKNETIAVLGYGSMGRAIALNFRDSGLKVIIGLRKKSRSIKAARSDKFKQIFTFDKAVQKAQYICFALPDHIHGRIFNKDVQEHLYDKSTLVFLHGFSVHFGFVKPPDNCDVILIAPHAPGQAVREKYLTEQTISAFFAIHQNYTGDALKNVFTLARAIGFKRKRLVKTSFEAEALGDLFGEQAVLCGGLAELIQNGFEVLVEKGIPSENAYLEVAYQLDLIIQLIKQYGIEGMYQRISVAARYGSALKGKKVIDKSVKKRMREVFNDINSGNFAKKLNSLTDKDISKINKLIKKRVNPAFEKAVKKYAE